jgi:hypothetical protein
MTTIAYNHKDKQIAVDGRLVKGSHTIITDELNKIKEKDGRVFIMSGDSASIEKLVKNYPDIKGTLSCSGFLVEDKKVNWVVFDDDGINITSCDWSETAGSGCDHALTAMDMGASAADAVKMACKRDPFSGGDILVYCVETGKTVNMSLATCGTINKHVE